MLVQVQSRGVVAEAEPSTGKGRSQVSASSEAVIVCNADKQVVGSHSPLCMNPVPDQLQLDHYCCTSWLPQVDMDEMIDQSGGADVRDISEAGQTVKFIPT